MRAFKRLEIGDLAAKLLSMLLVGDSHVAGYKATRYKPDRPPLEETTTLLLPVHIGGAYSVLDLIVTYLDGRQAINPLLDEALRHWPGLNIKGDPEISGATVQKHILLSIGTSAHACDPAMEAGDRANHRLFFKPGVDFLLPDHPELPVDRTCKVLPMALIQELFKSILEPLKRALTFLSPRYPARVWIVGSPPPPSDNTKKQGLVRARYVGGSPHEVELAPPAVTLKTWFLVNRLVAEICAETGCRFIDCASVACDEMGFLRKEFEFDGFHASSSYNELMTRHILSMVLKSEFSVDIDFTKP